VCTLADTPNLEVGRVGEFAEREKKLNYRNVRPYKKQPGQGGEETGSIASACMFSIFKKNSLGMGIATRGCAVLMKYITRPALFMC